MTPDFAQAREQLELLFGGAPAGHVALSYKPPNSGMQTQFFPVSDLDRIAQSAIEIAPHAHVYVTGGVLDGPKYGGRGSQDDVIWTTQVNLDFDVGQEGHKTNHQRPEHKDDIHRLLDALAPEIPAPSRIYDTGNGLLVVWRLEEPLVITCTETRERAKGLVKGFQTYVLDVAQRQFGWKLDRTSDLSRLVRVAGTLNWKSEPPKPVRVFQ